MKPREWADREGLHVQTVWRWCREGTMPVPVERTPTGAFLIHDPKYETPVPSTRSQTVVCYARVSSSDQKDDLVRQCDRVKAFAYAAFPDAHISVVSEVGSGMNDRRKKLNSVLGDPDADVIVVEHRDRLTRINFGLLESALRASGRRIVVVDDTEVDDDIVRDMTEVLTSFCARLYGKRSAKNRAHAAMEAAAQ